MIHRPNGFAAVPPEPDMDAQEQLDTLLQQHQFVLVRQYKHKIYRNLDSRVFVTASTPSDWRAARNNLSRLRKIIESPAMPEILAISQFECELAAEKIKPQEKKTAGGQQAVRTAGTGFTYIDRKIVVTAEDIEFRQRRVEYERAQKRWNERVRAAKQQFLKMAMDKYEAWHETEKQEYARWFKEYADTWLEKDVMSAKTRHHQRDLIQAFFDRARSLVYSSAPPDILSGVFQEATHCTACVPEDICLSHKIRLLKTFAYNFADFLPSLIDEFRRNAI